MNKKDALKLKPGRWIEVQMRGLKVALVVARSIDLGGGMPAQVSVLCEGRFIRIGHQDILQDTGLDLEVPDGPTAISRARTPASLRSTMAPGVRKTQKLKPKTRPEKPDDEEGWL